MPILKIITIIRIITNNKKYKKIIEKQTKTVKNIKWIINSEKIAKMIKNNKKKL